MDARRPLSLDEQLRQQLEVLRERDLLRTLRPVDRPGRMVERADGRVLVNLSSNDYLGLATHPAVVSAVRAAASEHGVGSGASRLVVGDLALHRRAERAVAELKGAQAALLLPTGYMANLAVFGALAGPGDRVLLDRLCHASLIDAARASGAAVRRYPHLDLKRLEAMLERGYKRKTVSDTVSRRTFIVTDSVFSMDGDVADLPALCELSRRHDAVLVVDEAHGTGVLGERGGGLAEAQGVHDIAVCVTTASKALGSLGGLVTGSATLIEAMVNLARPFIYTTAAPPTQAAGIEAAVRVIQDEPERRRWLLDMSAHVRRELTAMGWPLPGYAGHPAGSSPAPAPTRLPTPIIPLITGDASSALALADHLERAGLLAVAIRPPTVPPGTARVRLSLRADLEDEDVQRLLRAVREGEKFRRGGPANNR